ncbi:MAG: hypothetical protein ABEN55_03040, partial [Bradymonadaceae bacterium]
MLQNRLFLVLSNHPAASDDFNFDGSIGAGGWFFQFPSDIAEEDQSETSVVIFKFAPGKLRDLVGDTDAWVLGKQLNGGKNNRDDIADSVRSKLDQLPQKHQDILKPNWSGILAFDFAPDEQAMPDKLKGLLQGMPDDFRADYLGVEINQVRTSESGLEMKRSSVFGKVHYQADPNAPFPPDDAPEFTYRVKNLEIVFDNSKIISFDCTVQLWIGQLFGDEPAEGTESQKVELQGTYEERNGEPFYSFSTQDSHSYDFDAENSFLEKAELTKVELQTDTDDPDSAITTRFGIWGGMKFRASDDITGDFFIAGHEVSLDDMGIEIPFTETGDIDTQNVKLDLSAIRLEIGETPETNLLTEFPLRLRALEYATNQQEFSLREKGFFSLSDAGNVNYGLVFDLDLGSLGQLVPSAGQVTAQLMIGWAKGASTATVGWRLDEMQASGPIELDLMGVVSLYIGDYKVEHVDTSVDLLLARSNGDSALSTQTDTYAVALKDCRVGFLGLDLPPEQTTFDIVLFPPAESGKNAGMGWLSVVDTSSGSDQTATSGSGPFQLHTLALGQRVAFAPNQTSVKDFVEALASVELNEPSEVIGEVTGGNSSISRDSDVDWAVALDMDVLGAESALAMVDGRFYGAHLNIPPVTVDIQYRVIGEDIGAYATELESPWRRVSFGAATLTVPNIGLEYFTNGDFVVDVGFPHDSDYSRSFHLEALPFVGA